MKITTVGIDLAKNVLQVHGVDARGKAVLKKQLKRGPEDTRQKLLDTPKLRGKVPSGWAVLAAPTNMTVISCEASPTNAFARQPRACASAGSPHGCLTAGRPELSAPSVRRRLRHRAAARRAVCTVESPAAHG